MPMPVAPAALTPCIGARSAARVQRAAAGVLLVGGLLVTAVQAQAPAPAARPVAAATPADSRPTWASLTVSQQLALAPLRTEWAAMDSSRKQKWLELAAKMPAMSAAERDRIQQRMTDWVRMTPSERGRARLQFQEAQLLAPGDRAGQWEAYQALPPDQRQALAAQATAKRAQPSGVPSASAAASAVGGKPARTSTMRATAAGGDAKRNIVPITPGATQAKAVAPTVVQSKTGATTSLVTTQARPPVHHQAGLPKVNARSDFVDRNTLLPRRGPQGAAVAAMPAASGADATP
jgi:hypothetical protein